jgi:hypothetical protein
MILNMLAINRKDGLFGLIVRPDGASLQVMTRVHRAPRHGSERAMTAQDKMGHSSMSEGWRDHTSPAEERVNQVMDEVMSGRMSEADGMAELEKAHEMMRAEARARTTYPEHRWED